MTVKAHPIPRGTHLTAGHGEAAERQHARTYAGQAHFAASGPFGRTCGECRFYGLAYARIRNAAGEIIETRRKPHACGKFAELTGRPGADVPELAEACRYFEPKAGTP